MADQIESSRSNIVKEISKRKQVEPLSMEPVATQTGPEVVAVINKLTKLREAIV